jgi:hypothetical protein
MCGKKKSESCSVLSHPVVCGAIIGLAVIGACGVVMAIKKKKKRLSRAAKGMGCECVENVCDMTEEAMDSMEHLVHHRQ